MTEDPSINEVQIKFLDCCPGKVYYKYFEWQNIFKISSIEHINYSITSRSVFYIEEDKNKYNTIKIIYKPLLANCSTYDYYIVTTSSNESKKLCLFGKTLGIEVHCDTKLICLDCITSNPMINIVNLINTSFIDTYFQFINDNENSGIIIKPLSGIIKQNETVKIVFTYYPKYPGFAYKKIFCLVKFQQEPIILEIRINFKRTSTSSTFRDFIYLDEALPKYYNACEEFVADVTPDSLSSKKPFFTIDRKYISFGYKDLVKGNTVPFETFTIVNNTLIDCVLSWNTECCKVFKINPVKCVIKSNSCQLHSATFEPTTSGLMYAAEICANLNWGSDSEFVIPWPLSINFLGHTLTQLRSGWDPFYAIEHKRFILPATVPNYPTTGILLLSNTGILPLMFKIFVPYNSNFVAKPEQGIIEEGFQMILIRFLAGAGVQNAYCENWELELNAHLTIKLQICATAEYPYLQISENNLVQFPPTSMQCEDSVPVCVVNKTHLHFNYRISTEDSSFYTEEKENTIGPMEQQYMKMFFRPNTLGEIVTSLVCDMSLVLPEIPDITNKSVAVLKGSCMETDLSSHPQYLRMDGFINSWTCGSFIINNESECTAYIKLSVYLKIDGKPCPFPYKLKPNFLILKGNTPMQIEIDLRPNFDGSEKLKIGYILYTNDQFKERVLNSKNVEFLLIDIEMVSSKPTLTIKDVRTNNAGQNLSKLHCWKILKIDKINNALQNLMMLETLEPIYMKLPTFEEDSEEIFIELLIENKSKYGVELNIEYEKICPCKCQLVDKSISVRLLTSTCIHEQQILFVMKKRKYPPKEQGIVEIHCNYTTMDINLFKFILTATSTDDPSLNGSVALYIERNCCAKQAGVIDFYHNSLNDAIVATLDPVFVGDPSKPIQIIWTYNNSLKEIKYSIEVQKKYKNMIFNFLNTRGCIAPQTMHPLFIKFVPKQFINYSINGEFITAARRVSLTVKGMGKSHPCYRTSSMPHFLPLVSHFESNKNVNLSIDHIVLKPMLIHSIKKRLIFLKNNSEDRMQFFWSIRQFGALLNISAMPASGVIEPKETVICQIFIHALSSPSRFNAYFTCKIINLTKEEIYLESSKKYKATARLFDSGFVYCDNEYVPEDVEVNIFPKPKPEYLNLTISVHTLSERYLDMVMPNLEDQVRSLNQFEITQISDPCTSITTAEADVVIDVLTKVTWEVLNKKLFMRSISRTPKNYYYKDILINEEYTPLKSPPNHLILNILNGITCNLLANMLNVEPQWGTDIFMKNKKTKQKKKHRRFSNEYYQGILDSGPYCVMSTYCEQHNILERRRSDTARRRTTRITFYEDDKDEDFNFIANLNSSIL